MVLRNLVDCKESNSHQNSFGRGRDEVIKFRSQLIFVLTIPTHKNIYISAEFGEILLDRSDSARRPLTGLLMPKSFPRDLQHLILNKLWGLWTNSQEGGEISELRILVSIFMCKSINANFINVPGSLTKEGGELLMLMGSQ